VTAFLAGEGFESEYAAVELFALVEVFSVETCFEYAVGFHGAGSS
jgi:hypothetical protein